MNMKVIRDEFLGVDRMKEDELRELAHDLLSENARLREMLSESRQACEHLFTELKRYKSIFRTRPIAMNALFDENTKLRELVRDYDKCLDTALYLAGNAGYPCMPDSGLFSSLHPRMRELGIEVSE